MLEPRAGLGRPGPRALRRGAPTARVLEEAGRAILWQRGRYTGTSRAGRSGRNRGDHQRRSPAGGGPTATRLATVFRDRYLKSALAAESISRGCRSATSFRRICVTPTWYVLEQIQSPI